MDGNGGSNTSPDKANLGTRVPSGDVVSARPSPREGQQLWGNSGPNHVDARTLATIPKVGEVNGREPTSLVSWSDKKAHRRVIPFHTNKLPQRHTR